MNIAESVFNPSSSGLDSTWHELELPGCSPTPFVNYLKACGLLKILQKILPAAKGYWRSNVFILCSPLPKAELVDKIIDDYKPSPICTPWNGSSGLYGEPPARLQSILNFDAPRFKKLKYVYQEAKKLIESEGLKSQPKSKNKKVEFIRKARALGTPQNEWDKWLNIVSVEKIEYDSKNRLEISYAYPGITGGTGGAIGNKDLGAVFLEALNLVFNLETGVELPQARRLLMSSLDDVSIEQTLVESAVLTQFSPINDYYRDISGAKAHSEYAESGRGSTSMCNPVDAILMFEGLLTFSSESESSSSQSSQQSVAKFSLAVDLASGTADLTTVADEKSTRLEELWWPLWKEPLTWDGLRNTVQKQLNRLPNQQVSDSIDFATKLSLAGVVRELGSFVRYSFLPRKGQANFAVCVGRFDPSEKLEEDLGAEIRSFRRFCYRLSLSRDTTARIRSAVMLLEKELFELARGKGSYLNCLVQLGKLTLEIGNSTILKTRKFVMPPPYLSHRWIDRVLETESSVECRLAAAIASLSLRKRAIKVNFNSETKSFYWNADRVLVWNRSSLTDNLIALQRQWAIEQSQGVQSFGNVLISPKIEDIVEFINGSVDDRAINEIAIGFSLCKQESRKFECQRYVGLLPPHYGLTALCQWETNADGRPIGGAIPIVNALSRNRSQDAVSLAVRRLRSQKLSPISTDSFEVPNSRRIGAAVAFPLSRKQLKSLQNYHIES